MGESPGLSSRVLVLSGPSGSGKSTIVDRLIVESAVPVREAVSATTRQPRPGERDGREYHFLDTTEFETRRARGEFVECAEGFGAGAWYGTLESEIEVAWSQRAWALLEIDVEGALAVMQRYPDALTIFLLAPSMEAYRSRLESRGTESPQAIARRVETAESEIRQADKYRYQVVNDNLDRAVAEIVDILSAWEEKIHA